MIKFLMGQGPQGALAAPSFILPSTGDGYESEEEGEEVGKPLTQEELRARAVKGISRREHKPPAASTQHQVPPSTAVPSKARGGTGLKKRAIATR